VSCSCYR